MRVTSRARTREDRAGDPLDGLVNLFDLGIVLALAFMLAALSSLDLTTSVLERDKQRESRPPADSVVAGKNEKVRAVELRRGQRVVGRGEQVGRLYRLRDGRTIVVRAGRRP